MPKLIPASVVAAYADFLEFDEGMLRRLCSNDSVSNAMRFSMRDQHRSLRARVSDLARINDVRDHMLAVRDHAKRVVSERKELYRVQMRRKRASREALLAGNVDAALVQLAAMA